MRLNKFQTAAYWTTTGLMALPLVAGGIGGIAVLAPRLARLKEWAYAGIFFDLTGAAISHAASGDGASKVSVPLLLAALAVASWMLRPESRKLGSTFAVPAAA